MPEQRTVYRWLAHKDHEEFRQQYARARELQADTLADECLDIADDARNDWMEKLGPEEAQLYQLNGEHIQRSRLRIDQRKWMAGKLKPKVYGDKQETVHSGSVEIRNLTKEQRDAAVAAAKRADS